LRDRPFLYAALNTKTGKVQGKTAQRHTSKELVSFLEDVVAPYDAEEEIHIICDNLAAHKTRQVATFLDGVGEPGYESVFRRDRNRHQRSFSHGEKLLVVAPQRT
jgi:hypothetical protein